MNTKNKEFDNLIRLPQGVSDFKKLIEGNYKFVDKTLFIKDIIYDGAEVILITRPRRFGKTLNLSMLYYFLKHQDKEEKHKNLFENLEISKHKDFCQKHQHQHPVIFITFKDVKESNFDDAYAGVAELISKLYEKHKHLLEDDLLSESQKNRFNELLDQKADRPNLTSAIERLALYIYKKFKKNPIILIDEYDTPIQEAYLKGYYEEMVGLMRSIFGKALKDNDYLQKGIVTGITRVAQESLFSGVNNLKVYSLLREEYGQYFGFTEEEVIKLIAETKQTISIDEIRKWYNGYQIGKHTLYNPWSIISCLDNNGKLDPYWVNTSSNDLVGRLLSNADSTVKHSLERLLQSKSIEQPLSENLVFTNIKTQTGALWSLLLYAGYLKVLSTEWRNRKLMATLSIPNEEIFFVYDAIIDQWLNGAVGSKPYNAFIQALSDGNLDEFKTHLASYIMKTASYFDFNQNTPEQIFHIFILGLVVGLRDHYYIYSNRESGFGRFDVIFIPHNKHKKGIILELKVAEKPTTLKNKAKEALAQIKDKQYSEEFKTHKVKAILAIGLAFCGKQVELSHENINLF